jgi:two-component system OmpR family sensor kinase
MSRSLQRHLSRSLAIVIVLISLVAAGLSFVFSYVDAKELQDDMLRQIAALAADQGKNAAPKPDNALHDAESKVMVLRLQQDVLPTWLPENLRAGFHTVSGTHGRYRVYVRGTQGEGRVAVAQPIELREEIAVNGALRTFMPMALLSLLLAWLAARIVRSELEPINRLSRELDEQSAERPQPLADRNVPIEITPFVHAINRLLARVARLIGQQQRFIADAAHELRSPLTALSIQAENLQKAPSWEIMKARTVPLREGVERSRRLAEQLLSLASTQVANHSRTQVDILRLLRELISESLPIAEARHIDMELETDGDSHVISCEPDLLRLVLKNALDNAMRYTPQNGKVTLRHYVDGEYAVVEISDTGPGIPVDARERVFDAFHRLNGAGSEGSGLGLAIAREAAARLGGAISLHDRSQGIGLLFRYKHTRFR